MRIRAIIIGLILLSAVCPALGATRYYLPSSGAPGVYPTATPVTWKQISGTDWVRMSTTKMGTAMTNKSTATTNEVGNVLNRVYVSDPIAATTISGTVSGSIKVSSLYTAKSYVVIKVVSFNGLTTRGTLYSGLGSNTWTTSTLNSRGYPLSVAVSPVTALEGDRIVIEVGAYKNDAATFPIINSFGDNSTTDLTATEGDTSANNPWVEFSTDIGNMTYTRFYLPNTGEAAVLPAYTSGWNTTYASRIKLVTSKISSAFVTQDIQPGTGTTGYYLVRQYISDPLKAQTISGSIRGQIRCRATAGANAASNRLYAKIMSNDGTVQRGNLTNGAAYGASYFLNQLTDKSICQETAMLTVTAQEGDRLVIEIGLYKADAGNMRLGQEYGDPVASDLPISETDTNQYCPWVELSGQIRFNVGGGIMIIQRRNQFDDT